MNYDKVKKCCFTGYRPQKFPFKLNSNIAEYSLLISRIEKTVTSLIEDDCKVFYSGMAEGFDMIGGETLLELRKKYKEIKIIAVVPCKNQEIKWKPEQQKRYKHLLKKCDKVIILQDNYTTDCMNKRNKYMVEHSSVVIACFNGKPSGTGNTIRIAKEKGCKVRIINPEDYK